MNLLNTVQKVINYSDRNVLLPNYQFTKKGDTITNTSVRWALTIIHSVLEQTKIGSSHTPITLISSRQPQSYIFSAQQEQSHPS